MNHTTDDLRAALEHRAESAPTPDPHALLADVAGDVTTARADRRRTRVRLLAAAAATAVAVTAGALLIDRPGDVDGAVLPAEPDTGYTEGYGIVDGELQPFTAEGLELVEQLEATPNGGARLLDWQTSDEVPTYAQAWCTPVGTLIEISLGEVDQQLTCADPDEDNPLLPGPLALPPEADEPSVHLGGDATGPATVGIYEEAAWSDFPFAAPQSDDSELEAPETGAVIDGRTPRVENDEIARLTGTRSAPSLTLPIEEGTPVQIQADLVDTGQLLIAIDGVIITNDGEEFDRAGGQGVGPWEEADPTLRGGYFYGFGVIPQGAVWRLDAETLTAQGADLSDGEVTVTVVPRGVSDDDWQVRVDTTAGAAPTESEAAPPVDDDSFPEQAYGQRKVGVYDVPMDGSPYDIPSSDPAEATYLARCPADVPPFTQIDVASSGRSELLQCSYPDTAPVDLQWSAAVTGIGDSDTERRPGDESTVSVVAPAIPGEMTRVAVYEPVLYQDWSFAEATPPTPVDLFAVNVDVDQTVGEAEGGVPLVWTVGETVTLDDLDASGTAPLSIPEGLRDQEVALGVLSEGVGRFRIDTVGEDPQPLQPRPADPFAVAPVLERDGWWSSWTDQEMGFSMSTTTAIGAQFEDLVLTAEGYDGGSLEITVLVLAPEEDG